MSTVAAGGTDWGTRRQVLTPHWRLTEKKGRRSESQGHKQQREKSQIQFLSWAANFWDSFFPDCVGCEWGGLRLSVSRFIIARSQLGSPSLPCGSCVIKLRHRIWEITFSLRLSFSSWIHSLSLSLPLAGSLSVHYSLSDCLSHTHTYAKTHTEDICTSVTAFVGTAAHKTFRNRLIKYTLNTDYYTVALIFNMVKRDFLYICKNSLGHALYFNSMRTTARSRQHLLKLFFVSCLRLLLFSLYKWLNCKCKLFL